MGTSMSPGEAAPSSRPRRIGWALAGIAVVAIGAWLFGGEIAAGLEWLEAWIDGLGAWGLVAFVLVFVALTSVFVPDTALALIAGGLFGLGLGTLLVSVAGILGASLQYALARRLLRGPIERAVSRRPAWAAVLGAVREGGLGLQLLLRLTPVNPPAVSYTLGAAGVPYRTYVLACVGLVPAFFVEVYAGYVGRSVAGGAEASSTLETIGLIVGLVAAVLLLVVVTRLALGAVRRAAVDQGNASADSA